MSFDRKVILGISGGVDSAVSAHLLQRRGYEVIPVFLRVFDCADTEASLEDAGKVCEHLGLKLVVEDIREEFHQKIVDPFIAYYLSGETPNPCVYCNYLIKWKILYDFALKFGADYIATGHYSKILKLENERYSIQRSKGYKDQSYVMYHLPQEILSRILFPLSEYGKEDIRKLALDIRLPIAKKKDSQEICFVSDDYAGFIEERTNEVKIGNFVFKDGTVLGKHKGIHRYTVGQRKGLGISYKHSLFVLGIADNGQDIVLGTNEDLFSDRLTVNNLNFMGIEDLKDEMRVEVSIRYGHRGAFGTIRRIDDDRMECIFEKEQRAVTKGQAAVFYHEDYIIAGGIIE